MKPTEKVERHITTEDTLMDLLRNLFPPNIVQACTQQMSTQLIVPDNYNKDSEDVFSLTRNIYNISNTLLASFQAWTELTDFDQRYRLSTNILRIIDNTGFLFLSDHQLSASAKTQTNFSFEHLKVILDTIGPERSFSRCYDFEQVRI